MSYIKLLTDPYKMNTKSIIEIALKQTKILYFLTTF